MTSIVQMNCWQSTIKAILLVISTSHMCTPGTVQATPYATGALALWRHANANKLGSGRQVLDAAKTAFITTAAPIKLANDSRFAHSVVQAGAGASKCS
jgi:hypothetical protein